MNGFNYLIIEPGRKVSRRHLYPCRSAMRRGGRGEERHTTMHLIKIQIFTHASCITKFSTRRMAHECARTITALWYVGPVACACPREKKPVVFTAKYRKDLVADLGKKDYADIVKTAITGMQSGLHLDLFPPGRSLWLSPVVRKLSLF